jgi:hypothetical protein
MKEKTKYLLIGIAIGIAAGIAAFYLAARFGFFRPYGLRDFARAGNFTNFTRPIGYAPGG